MTSAAEQRQPDTTASGTTASDEVATLLSDLIRINTSNPTHPERPAAEWVAEKLDEVGIESTILESEPGRASTIARITGSNSRPAAAADPRPPRRGARPTPRSGRSTRSAARSRTTTSGAAARST